MSFYTVDLGSSLPLNLDKEKLMKILCHISHNNKCYVSYITVWSSLITTFAVTYELAVIVFVIFMFHRSLSSFR